MHIATYKDGLKEERYTFCLFCKEKLDGLDYTQENQMIRCKKCNSIFYYQFKKDILLGEQNGYHWYLYFLIGNKEKIKPIYLQIGDEDNFINIPFSIFFVIYLLISIFAFFFFITRF